MSEAFVVVWLVGTVATFLFGAAWYGVTREDRYWDDEYKRGARLALLSPFWRGLALYEAVKFLIQMVRAAAPEPRGKDY